MKKSKLKRIWSKYLNVFLTILFLGPLLIFPSEPDSILESSVLLDFDASSIQLSDLFKMSAAKWQPRESADQGILHNYGIHH